MAVQKYHVWLHLRRGRQGTYFNGACMAANVLGGEFTAACGVGMHSGSHATRGMYGSSLLKSETRNRNMGRKKGTTVRGGLGSEKALDSERHARQ
ncbi:hypothetical protein AMTR_s00122p00065820 [Amborella trichopoda]|uniref:Uncharacterized protein n=1 Tax=Amborella trichopoda TaxID=13333 RepID=W1NQF8_AMBTC|nr:hypothetical protein AMTR_s00122p00065820 [Amborella trichopoda]